MPQRCFFTLLQPRFFLVFFLLRKANTRRYCVLCTSQTRLNKESPPSPHLPSIHVYMPLE